MVENCIVSGAKEAAEKVGFRVKIHKEHPSGAKAQRLFSATCGTLRLRSGQAIEAVPFQNFGHLVVIPQPVKPNIDLIGFIGMTEVMA